MHTNADRAQKLDACMAFYTSAYRLTHDNSSMDVSMAVSMASLELRWNPFFLVSKTHPPDTRPPLVTQTHTTHQRREKGGHQLGPCSIDAIVFVVLLCFTGTIRVLKSAMDPCLM